MKICSQKQNYFKLAAWSSTAIALVFLPEIALAQTTIFTSMTSKVNDAFYNFRSIGLIICGVAIIATMISAISGNFPMKKALSICGAIFVMGVVGSIVTYLAGKTETVNVNNTVPTLTDTNSNGSGSQ